MLTWLLAGSRLGERLPLTAAPSAEDAEPDLATDDDELLTDVGALPAPVPIRVPEPDPEPAPTAAHAPPEPAPVAPPRPVVRDPATPGTAAQRTFHERLAYSPKRDEARRLLDEIARAEREGRAEDAAALADQIERM
jgi:hypothetical protein